MAVAEVVVVSDNYMGAWEEGPNYWKWKSSSKETVSIPLRRNGSYDDMGKIHPTFINNDRHVSLYMLDVATDGSRTLLRINVLSGFLTIDEHDSFEEESLDAHPMDSEDHPIEFEDPIFFEKGGEECEYGAQTNQTFSNGTNF
ncbi:hypothetical protein BC332_32187 [Capsicum chinense]|nr:hypothetical protein BC332_32187 [Capsicum chinense]